MSLMTAIIATVAIAFSLVVFAILLIKWAKGTDQEDEAYRAGKNGRIFNPESYRTVGYGRTDTGTLRHRYLAGVRYSAHTLGIGGYGSKEYLTDFYRADDQEAINTYLTSHAEAYNEFTNLRNSFALSK